MFSRTSPPPLNTTMTEEKTKDAQIRSALRMLFLRSKERQARLKADNYTCTQCHRKQTTKKGQEIKVQVHHKENICNWQKIFEVIREQLLCSPEKMTTLCKECHKEETRNNV